MCCVVDTLGQFNSTVDPTSERAKPGVMKTEDHHHWCFIFKYYLKKKHTIIRINICLSTWCAKFGHTNQGNQLNSNPGSRTLICCPQPNLFHLINLMLCSLTADYPNQRESENGAVKAPNNCICSLFLLLVYHVENCLLSGLHWLAMTFSSPSSSLFLFSIEL